MGKGFFGTPVTDVKATTAGADAARAAADGRTIFVYRAKVAATQAAQRGPLEGIAEQIEAIEAAGWVLHPGDMSFDAGNSLVLLFRRAGTVTPGR